MLSEDEKAKVKAHYIKGEGSIQDIARVYRISTEDVLRIIGETELLSVTTQGDMIDANEAGSGAVMNYGKEFNITYSTD